jgi:hypothetical protein
MVSTTMSTILNSLFKHTPGKLTQSKPKSLFKGIPLSGLNLPHLCACSYPGPGFPSSYVVVFFVFSNRWEVFSNRWEVYSNRWEVYNNRWEVFSNRWEVFSNRWEVFSNSWEVFSNRWEVFVLQNCWSLLFKLSS